MAPAGLFVNLLADAVEGCRDDLVVHVGAALQNGQLRSGLGHGQGFAAHRAF